MDCAVAVNVDGAGFVAAGGIGGLIPLKGSAMAMLQSEQLFDIQVELGEIQQLGETPRGSRLIATLAGITKEVRSTSNPCMDRSQI